MENVLIVESKNDKDFVEAVLRAMSLENTAVGNPICMIDDFDCMGGLNHKKLSEALNNKIGDITKGKIQRIGILIDQDQKTKIERLDFVSKAVNEAFVQEIRLQDTNKSVVIALDADTSFELICHFTNVDGSGELETLLKAIKTKDSTFADCLDKWRDCLATKKKKISQKEFDKFWISNYIRFDTCTNRQKKRADRKCNLKNFDYVLESKEIFDLNHEKLTELRAFLSLFDQV